MAQRTCRNRHLRTAARAAVAAGARHPRAVPCAAMRHIIVFGATSAIAENGMVTTMNALNGSENTRMPVVVLPLPSSRARLRSRPLFTAS